MKSRKEVEVLGKRQVKLSRAYRSKVLATYLYKIAAWGGTEDKSNTLHPLAITSA
jgi:hypothetical protein